MEEKGSIFCGLFEFLSSDQTVREFQQWVYAQNSTEFEKWSGDEEYLVLVSTAYKDLSKVQVKQLIKSLLSNAQVNDFEQELIQRNRKAIIGKCINEEAPNYEGSELRKWGVVLGKTYQFLSIKDGSTEGNRSYVNFIDPENDFYPSGFVPMELFEINLEVISEVYDQNRDEKGTTLIEIADFSVRNFIPRHYSFWEDFYDDDVKAVAAYFEVVKKLGIINLWS